MLNVSYLEEMYNEFTYSTLKLLKYNELLIEGRLTPEDYLVLVEALANKNLAHIQSAPKEENNMQA